MTQRNCELISFYRFAKFDDYKNWQEPLIRLTKGHIKGTIILAPEGINVNLYGPKNRLNLVLKLLSSDRRFANLKINRTSLEESPYNLMKIKCKQEIITFRQKELMRSRGKYLTPEEWNQFIQQQDTIVLDVRNDFENALGSFHNATNPNLESFSMFADYANKHLSEWQDKNLALFCTGGIRCEKSSFYLMARGLTNVYQLSGGIIHYLQQVPPASSRWEGECFVFDDRIVIKQTGCLNS